MDPRRNQFDRRDSLELGDRAEDLFARLALARGWKVGRATEQANLYDHWDFYIYRDKEGCRVDVKAMKRARRGDAQVQDQWLWVELHGVRDYDRGWLYAGKADLIAVETSSSFLMVRRQDLIRLVEGLVDTTGVVSSAREAKYKVYTRPGRPDKITMIETQKLHAIKWDEWQKV